MSDIISTQLDETGEDNARFAAADEANGERDGIYCGTADVMQ